MKSKKNIQQEVEKTLGSLDHVQRAEANPYLFTRIKARLQQPGGEWERITSFISRPAIALTTLVLIMAINAWVVFNSNDNHKKEENVASMDIADMYNQTAATNFDYENPAAE